jgi:ATP-dependent Zn protease
MLKESYGRVRDNLILNRDVVENIAMELLKKETMSAQEV